MVACLVMTCAKDPPSREDPGHRAAPRAAAAARDGSGPPAVAPASAAAAQMDIDAAANPVAASSARPAPARSGRHVPKALGSRPGKPAAPRPKPATRGDEAPPARAAPRARALAATAAPTPQATTPQATTPQATTPQATAAPTVQASVQASVQAAAPAPVSAAAGARGPSNLQVLPRSTGKRALKQRMRQMSKALGVQCSFCHVRGDMAADTPQKDTARQMMRMVEAINAKHLKRRDARVTCDTCHRGRKRPTH